MTAFKSDFLNILQERGFIHQCSDFEGLDALAAKGEAIAYVESNRELLETEAEIERLMLKRGGVARGPQPVS